MGRSDRHRALVGLWQYWCPTLYNFNLINFYQHSNYILRTNNCSDTDNIQLNPNIVFGILDSGATMHYLTPNTPGTDTKKLTCGTLMGLPDGSTTITTHSKKTQATSITTSSFWSRNRAISTTHHINPVTLQKQIHCNLWWISRYHIHENCKTNPHRKIQPSQKLVHAPPRNN